MIEYRTSSINNVTIAIEESQMSLKTTQSDNNKTMSNTKEEILIQTKPLNVTFIEAFSICKDNVTVQCEISFNITKSGIDTSIKNIAN